MVEDMNNKEGNNRQEEENREQQPPPEDNLKNSGQSTAGKDEGKEPPVTKKEKSVNIDTRVEGNVKNLDQAEKIYKFDQKDVKQFFLGEEKRVEIKKFSLSDAIPLLKENIIALQHVFVYPEDQLEDLVSCLTTHRLLLLTGKTQSGKYFTAKYLSFRMMEQNKKDYEVLMVSPLPREINIEPMELIKSPDMLKEKILIFKNVFSKKNQNLIDFLLSCSREQIEFIAKKLSELDAFILFTADSGTFDQFPLDNLHIKKDISPPGHDLLQKGLELKLKYFCSLTPGRDFNKASQLLEGKRMEIIDKLGGMPKIALFIDNYLDKMLSDKKSIDDAVQEVNDIRKRLEHLLLKELGMDKKAFETWTFALCLAIFNYSSYADFNEIHREITAILLEKLDPFQPFKNFTFTLSERELLEACRAQITKDIRTYADRIEFCDPGYQQVLLDILLSNNRKVLLHLVPFLTGYVENHYRQAQRRFASISLARIGVLDPEAITLPIIDKWANMQSNFHRANVGYLYEGIIASEDDIYLTYCMRKLKAMALSSDIDEQWTAIAAYKQIGLYDLEFAMKELRKIQEEIVERMFKKQNILDFLYSQTNLLNDRDIPANLDRIYKETGYLLSTVRYSIVALSININPIDVLNELKKWISEGNRNSRVSVVLFFMGNDGILEELEDREVVYLSKEDEKKKEELRSNLLLYALAAGEEPIEKMVEFLRDLYKKCFSEFRMDANKALKTLLLRHLEEWVKETLSNSKVNSALKKLILRFYNSGDEELKDTLYDSINRWKAPGEKEEKLNTFAEEIVAQMFPCN